MKIKCAHCDKKYDIQRNTQCPECGKTGGYMQEPSLKSFGNRVLNLEDVLVHVRSRNEYQIKEFQQRGLIAVVKKHPFVPSLVGKRVYVNNESIDEYNQVAAIF